MPRLARKNINSSYCHVIVQGIDKEYIFKNDNFKKIYMSMLKKNLLDTQASILAYCIMSNHAHILIYSEKLEDITKIMLRTNTSYAKLYNKSNNRVGYVFRDRYYTQPITSEKQLFNCIAYIHNNPIKAHIVNNFSEYPYSSYNEYLGKKDLLTLKSIKLVFGSSQNYIEQFNLIHKNKNIEDIIDISEQKNSNQVIQSFITINNKKLDEIIKDETIFSQLLLDLRHCCNLSLRDMSKIFNISKDKLNKIINKFL